MKGKPRIRTTLGNAAPSAKPHPAPIIPTWRRAVNDPGNSPTKIRPSTAIQNPAIAPTKTPNARSRAVAGRLHQALSSAARRSTKEPIKWHLTPQISDALLPPNKSPFIHSACARCICLLGATTTPTSGSRIWTRLPGRTSQARCVCLFRTLRKDRGVPHSLCSEWALSPPPRPFS